MHRHYFASHQVQGQVGHKVCSLVAKTGHAKNVRIPFFTMETNWVCMATLSSDSGRLSHKFYVKFSPLILHRKVGTIILQRYKQLIKQLDCF